MTQNTGLLKAVVIGLGIAIVVMFFLVIGAIVMRLGPETGPAKEAAVPVGPGERVESIAGAGPNVVLRMVGPAGERLLTVDPVTGRVISILSLAPQTATVSAP